MEQISQGRGYPSSYLGGRSFSTGTAARAYGDGRCYGFNHWHSAANDASFIVECINSGISSMPFGLRSKTKDYNPAQQPPLQP